MVTIVDVLSSHEG